jgi:plastocyanin
MRNRYNFAIVLSAVVLVCCAALLLNQNVNAAGDGKITGTVKLDGTAPHMKGIDMSKDPYCSKAHATDPGYLETYVAGANGGLENVVLYISDWSGPAQTTTTVPVFDQKNCMYRPHVLAMDVGQPFKVTTSDATAHNIHPNPNPMTGNIPWNQSQPPGAPPVEKSWKATEFIEVKCNIHPWMHGTFAVLKNSHYSVSDADGGFKLPNLQPGKYTVTAYHESYGDQTQDVVISGNETKTISFLFKAKAY